MRPPERGGEHDVDGFDPVVEGARYQLSRELSLALWQRVCADATEQRDDGDAEPARQRFRAVAARIAARGGRLRPDAGRQTRVGVELDGDSLDAWLDELSPRVPGRDTLVNAEARRAARRPSMTDAHDASRNHAHDARRDPDRDEHSADAAVLHLPSPTRETLAALARRVRDAGGSAEPSRPIHTDEPSRTGGPGGSRDVRASQRAASGARSALSPAQALAAFQRAWRWSAATDATVDPLLVDLSASGSAGPRLDERRERAQGSGRIPVDTLDRMERAFGQRFDDVELHPGSAEVPQGAQAFTRGRHIYLEPGADLDSDHGEHVIAHELAHVAQQSQPSAGRPAPRAALEADAHQAALSALAGRAASVSLFAPQSAALGFSDGEAPARSSSSSSSGGKPAQSARGGAAPAPSAPRSAPPASGRGARPAPTARPGATSSKAGAPASAPAKRGGGDGLLVPEAPTALTPAAAGRLQTTQAGNVNVATATTTLPTAQQQTTVAREAVVEPQAEQDAHAQHGVVTQVDDRPPPSPEIVEACAHIRQVIRDKRPPDEDKLVEAKPREMAQQAGEQMSAGVEQRAGTVREGYAGIQNSPAGTPTTTPIPATLPPAQAHTPTVDGAAGTPDPLASDDVSLDGDVAAQKQKIEDAGMNTEPGKLVQDGPIGDARDGADELGTMAKTDPQKVLADQAKAIASAKGDMVALQAAAEKALADARVGAVSDMGKHTTGVKGSEEQQRAQAGEKMKAVFTRTQQSVDKLLQPLSGNAVARWDAGVASLSSDFEASLADVKAKIDERHSGVGGFFNEVGDSVFGLPAWVTARYDAAEQKFGDGATSLITDISRDVNKVINDCKELIKLARKEIDDIVKALPASLQTWAQGEAAKLGKQLDQLDQRVDQTQKGLNQDLIGRANGAVQQVRERVADLREAAKGLVGKIASAIGEFLKNPAKAIINGLLTILGIPPGSFWSLIDRLGDVVGAIAKDPVKFGKTLISGAAQGFQQFFSNFPTHLREIMMSWLFGTMAGAGVQMPSDFSGPSIMVTVLGIVGVDSTLVTAMIGGEGGDTEEVAEMRQELAGVLSGDPKAMVALLREHFDPASLVPMIRDAALSFIMQALITRVAARIAALLVPGGAILQAVEAIFRVLLWVVTNAARIFTLIEALVGTAGAAAAGNVGAVANGVETSLVQIIVLVIDFLAGYLGLGGLPGKLKGVLMKLGGKLKGALKKVLDAVKKRAKTKAKAKRDKKKAEEAKKKQEAEKKKQEEEARKKKEEAEKKQQQAAKGDGNPNDRKEDEREAQRRKDDAKDPRNHKRDEDDNDPRNHKDRDDDDSAGPKKPKDHDARDPKNREDGDDAKDPKKRKDDDKDPNKRKDDDRLRELNERLQAAEREIRRRLNTHHHTESEGRAVIAQVATAHGARHTVQHRAGSWHVELSINPKLDLLLSDDEQKRQAVLAKLKDSEFTRASIQKAINQEYNERFAPAVNALHKNRADAVKAMRGEIAEIVDSILADPLKYALAKKKDPRLSGDQFEALVQQGLKADADAKGWLFLTQPAGVRSGFDAVTIDIDSGLVRIHEIKAGELKSFDTRSSRRGTSSGQRIHLDPEPDPNNDPNQELNQYPAGGAPGGRQLEGASQAVRHIMAHPRHSLLLVEDHVLIGERTFENKVSAVTANFQTNLKTARTQLLDLAADAEDATYGAKCRRAAEMITSILENQADEMVRVERVISTRGRIGANQLEAVNALLHASVARLPNVRIDDIIQDVSDDGIGFGAQHEYRYSNGANGQRTETSGHGPHATTPRRTGR